MRELESKGSRVTPASVQKEQVLAGIVKNVNS